MGYLLIIFPYLLGYSIAYVFIGVYKIIKFMIQLYKDCNKKESEK